jgi:hypothetical protein
MTWWEYWIGQGVFGKVAKAYEKKQKRKVRQMGLCYTKRLLYNQRNDQQNKETTD